MGVGLMAGRLMVARQWRAVGRPMANQPIPHRDPSRNASLVDQLMRERLGFLRAVARRQGTAPQAIDDVVQAALLSVLQSFPGPQDPDHIAAYAAQCVKHEAWRLHRRFSRKESRHVVSREETGLTPLYLDYAEP